MNIFKKNHTYVTSLLQFLSSKSCTAPKRAFATANFSAEYPFI